MGFLLKFILILCILYYGSKLVIRLLFRKLVNSNPLLSELYQQQKAYQAAQAEEGMGNTEETQYKNVKVKVPVSDKKEPLFNDKISDNSEYIEFEEVK